MKISHKTVNFILVLAVIYLSFALVQANGNTPKVTHKLWQVQNDAGVSVDANNDGIIDRSQAANSVADAFMASYLKWSDVDKNNNKAIDNSDNGEQCVPYENLAANSKVTIPDSCKRGVCTIFIHRADYNDAMVGAYGGIFALIDDSRWISYDFKWHTIRMGSYQNGVPQVLIGLDQNDAHGYGLTEDCPDCGTDKWEVRIHDRITKMVICG